MNGPWVKFGARSLALFLSLILGLSGPALALRNQQQEDPSQLSGLEEALKDPARAVRRLAPLVASPASRTVGSSLPAVVPVSDALRRASAGAEELTVDPREDWVGLQGRSLGRLIPVWNAQRILVGR